MLSRRYIWRAQTQHLADTTGLRDKKKTGSAHGLPSSLVWNFHGCMHSNINSGVIVDGITLS